MSKNKNAVALMDDCDRKSIEFCDEMAESVSDDADNMSERHSTFYRKKDYAGRNFTFSRTVITLQEAISLGFKVKEPNGRGKWIVRGGASKEEAATAIGIKAEDIARHIKGTWVVFGGVEGIYTLKTVKRRDLFLACTPYLPASLDGIFCNTVDPFEVDARAEIAFWQALDEVAIETQEGRTFDLDMDLNDYLDKGVLWIKENIKVEEVVERGKNADWLRSFIKRAHTTLEEVFGEPYRKIFVTTAKSFAEALEAAKEMPLLLPAPPPRLPKGVVEANMLVEMAKEFWQTHVTSKVFAVADTEEDIDDAAAIAKAEEVMRVALEITSKPIEPPPIAILPESTTAPLRSVGWLKSKKTGEEICEVFALF